MVVNSATGAVAQRLDYDSFGNVLLDTNPGFQPFGFQSGLYDGDTGLVQFGARWYDASTGRWLSKDPILLQGGLNLYVFCGNDPVNFADPSGLWFGIDDAIFAGTGALLGVAGRLAGDILTGSLSNWEDYAGSAVGGAAAGEVLL
jgi:RHS repeat-associated protein